MTCHYCSTPSHRCVCVPCVQATPLFAYLITSCCLSSDVVRLQLRCWDATHVSSHCADSWPCSGQCLTNPCRLRLPPVSRGFWCTSDPEKKMLKTVSSIRCCEDGRSLAVLSFLAALLSNVFALSLNILQSAPESILNFTGSSCDLLLHFQAHSPAG